MVAPEDAFATTDVTTGPEPMVDASAYTVLREESPRVPPSSLVIHVHTHAVGELLLLLLRRWRRLLLRLLLSLLPTRLLRFLRCQRIQLRPLKC